MKQNTIIIIIICLVLLSTIWAPIWLKLGIAGVALIVIAIFGPKWFDKF